MTRLLTPLLFLSFALTLTAQTPCENGFAGIYPCDGIELMSQLPLSVFQDSPVANDIWGWTDPETGHEWAIIGHAFGTAFVDVADPTDPIYTAWLPTHSTGSLWRDIKVFADHAFIVSEAGGHGLQVFDLTRLRDISGDLPADVDEDAHLGSFGNAHNIAINEETGFAYVIGAGPFSGGPIFIDINDPVNPTVAGGFGDEGYTHDSQIVIYNGPDQEHVGKELIFNSNGDTGAPVVIVDATDKADPQLISASCYDNLAYSHQGWLTGDHRFFLHNDEVDELDFGFNTRTHIWEISDLEEPRYVGFHEAETPSIDHNMYTRGDYLFQSNYTSGLRILEMSGLCEGVLTETAFFDTQPDNDAVGFNSGGTWSNYPYFASGNIIVSDMSRGLFVIRPTDEAINEASDEDASFVCDPDDLPPYVSCEALSIDEVLELRVGLAPNPASEVLTVTYKGDAFDLFLFDLNGREVARHIARPFDTQIDMNLSSLNKGVYLLRSNTTAGALRVVVE